MLPTKSILTSTGARKPDDARGALLGSVPLESSPRWALDAEERSRVALPNAANCSRCSGLHWVRPDVQKQARPLQRRHRRGQSRPGYAGDPATTSGPAATSAPVLRRDQAAALPSRTSLAPTTMEESRLCLTAVGDPHPW